MTLLELTVVILVLLTLLGVLFFAATAWKRGSDRAMCILHIERVQKGLRSYANAHGLEPGTAVAGLRDQLIGPGKYVESLPVCPAGGIYTFKKDEIPPYGELYMECSLGALEDHRPPPDEDW